MLCHSISAVGHSHRSPAALSRPPCPAPHCTSWQRNIMYYQEVVVVVVVRRASFVSERLVSGISCTSLLLSLSCHSIIIVIIVNNNIIIIII